MAVRLETQTEAKGEARAMDARKGNDRIAEKARRLHFVSRVPMLCECSARGCRTIVLISLADYDELRRDPAAILAAPGHEDDGTELDREASGYTVRRPAPGRLDRRSA